MTGPLIIAAPSKGRLKEPVENWLADAGLPLSALGGARGYRAAMPALPNVEVRMLPASDIAEAIDAGEIHIGVTGEDLLRESGELEGRVQLLQPLGFGRANLVVAAPQSWIDVETMADLDDVAHLHLNRTGHRLRVATKYLAQTRKHFTEHGLTDYRLVESTGATEGAPAQGSAEVVVDITTTGATLRANHLKVLSDGLILESQAHLAASLRAQWSAGHVATVRQLMRIVEARRRAKQKASLIWPAEQDAAAQAATAAFAPSDGERRANGLLVAQKDLFEISAALSGAGIGPVTVTRPDYVFEPRSAAADALEALVA